MGKPTYQELFGSADYYSVDPDRSVLSPAAYLVALVRLVESHIVENDPSTSLKARRPDIWSITLDDKNTDTLIPKLEIANQVLSAYLEEQNALESSDVLAYQAIRRYLAQSGTSLPQLWQQLTPNHDSATRHAIARETLQLSPQQWSQLKATQADLALALNWAPDELSLALQTLGLDATSVDDSALPPLAWIQTQTSANNYSVAQACACLGAPPATVTNAFLDQIAAGLAGNASWSVPSAGTTGFSSDHTIINALTSALQVGQDDLLAIARLASQGAASLPLDASGIAVLYRLSQLPRSTGLTIRDSLLAATLANVDISALTGSGYTKTLMRAITQLSDFCAWLKKSPLSLHQLQFILTGSSDNLAIQNKILGEDAVRNFLREIQRLRTQVHPSQQQQFFVDHLAALYGVPHQIGAVLADWADLNIAAIVAGAATSADSLADALPLNDPSAAATVLRKLQQAAELITALSLSPAEARYFKCAYQPTAQYPISLEAIKTEVLFRGLVRSFQDSQNHFLDILQGPSLRNLTSYTPSGPTAATYYAVASNLPYPWTTGTSGGDWGPPTAGIPGDAPITCLAALGGTLCAGTQSGLYYLNGNEWQQVWQSAQSGLPGNAVITCLGESIVGTQSGLYFQNESYEWQQVTPAAQNGLPNNAFITCLAELGGTSYAGTQSGLYLQNESYEWQQVTPAAQNGLPNNAFITCLAELGGTSYAGTQSGLYYLNGSNWQQVTPAAQNGLPNNAFITCLAQLGNFSYAGTQSGLYYLNGSDWQQVTPAALDGLPANAIITCMAELGSTSYVGTPSGLYYLNENLHWQLVGNGLPADAHITFLSECNSIPIVGTSRQMYALFTSNWAPIHFLDLRKLATLTSWQRELISLAGQPVAGLDTIAQVALYQQYFETASRLSITVDLLQRLLQLAAPAGSGGSDADASSLAKALYGGLQASYRNQLPVLAQINASAEVARRDWLVNTFKNKFKTQGLFNNARELFEYFLIDVEVDGSIQTSKIREATGAVQLYIYRCLNQLEPTVTVNQGLAQRWGWMYAYREWQANMEVLLYPEDYIQPELRRDKTDLFAKLESDLKQANLADPLSVESAFRDYMNGLAEVASLKIVGSAIRRFLHDGIDTKTLCLVGKTSQQPERYFYRLATFVDDQPSDWGQWQKISIQIHPVRYQENGTGPELTGAVTPTFAFGTWYLFWVEQKQSGSTPQGTSSAPTPQYTTTIHYTHLDYNQRWVAPQTLASIAALAQISTTTDSQITPPLQGGWVQKQNGPNDNGGISSFYSFADSLYANAGGSIYALSGATWTGCDLVDSGTELPAVNCLCSYEGTLYAGTDSGVYALSLSGETWSQCALPTNLNWTNVSCLYVYWDTLYVGGIDEVYAFCAGVWSAARLAANQTTGNSVNCLCGFGNDLYACADDGVYVLNDGTWSLGSQQFNQDENNVTCLYAYGGTLYAGTGGGVYALSGGTWSLGSLPANQSWSNVTCLYAYGGTLNAGASEGVYTLNLSDGTWSLDSLPSNQSWSNVTCLYAYGVTLYVGTGGGVYALSDGTWSLGSLPSNQSWSNVTCLYAYGGTLYAGTGGGVYALNALQVPYHSNDYAIERGMGVWGPDEFVALPAVTIQGGITTIAMAMDSLTSPKDGTTVVSSNYVLTSPVLGSLGALLHRPDGMDAMLLPGSQRGLGSSALTLRNAMSNYLWELFFFAPFLIAHELHVRQHFAHAKKWYEYIFNPSIVESGAEGNDKYWRFLGLRSACNPVLKNELAEPPTAELWLALNDPVEKRQSNVDPFDPQAIAMLRPIAYQKTVVSHYIDNLLAWGDSLFRENTRESIGEAEMLYVTADDLLGKEPQNLGAQPLPYQGELLNVRCLVTAGTHQYAGTDQGLYYRQTDGAWTLLTNTVPQDANVQCLAYSTTNMVYVGTSSGLWVGSGGNSGQWVQATFPGSAPNVQCLSEFQQQMLAGTSSGLYYADDAPSGSDTPCSYVAVGSATENGIPSTANIQCLVAGQDHQYAGTDQGLYYRQKNGGNWTLLTAIGQDVNVQCLAYSTTSMVYVGTSSGLWVGASGNDGDWTKAEFHRVTWGEPLSPSSEVSDPDISFLYEFNQQVHAGTPSGLYWHIGKEWGFPTHQFILVAAASTDGIADTANIQCMTASPDHLYVGTDQGLYYRQLNGNSKLLTQIPWNINVQCLSYSPASDMVYLGMPTGLCAGRGGNEGDWVLEQGLFGTPHNQLFLTSKPVTLSAVGLPKDIKVQCLAYSTTNMVYVGTSSGLWVGSGGNSGQWVQATFPGSAPNVQCLSEFQGQMLAGTSSGLYYADDAPFGSDTPCSYVAVGSATENGIPSTANIQCLVAGKWHQYAGTDQGLYYRQKDGGNWTLLTAIGQDVNIQCLAYSTTSTVYVGTSSGLWVGSGGNSGQWVQATFPGSAPNVQCLSEFQKQMLAGTSAGLYYADDAPSGSDTPCSYVAVGPALQNPIPATANIQCLVAGQQRQYAGTDQGLYYRQTDGAWTLLTAIGQDVNVQCLAYSTSGFVYVSTSSGLWTGCGGNEGSWRLLYDPAQNINVQRLICVPTASSGEDTLYIGTSKGLLQTAALSGLFGFPKNAQVLAYWDKIKLRLYNIRHGLTIDGKTDVLPLFQPPLNPMQLVEAVAAGVGVSQSIESLDCAPPYYRFEVMVEKAKAATQNAISLEQSLLSALEQKDAQKLAVLYNTNQRHILHLSRASGEDQLNAAEQNVLALQAGLASAQGRQAYYNQLIKAGLSAGEIAEVALTAAGLDIQVGADALQIAAIIGYLVPNIYGLADGGMQFGNAILQGANVLESAGSQLAQAGSLAGNIASFQRRAQEWQLQASLAQDEVTQISYQIVAAQYQQHMAQQGITLLEANIDREESVARFYLSKFTNEQLYHWYIGKVSSLYFQAYQLAHDLALQAQHAWKYEQMGRGAASANKQFIVPGNWNSLYQGLLAGESLQLDLQRMEKAYLDQNQRRLEITKTISLARLKPEAFLLLKNTGACDFHITEQDFDADYPGHYCRLIKSISVSLPLVLGPYQDIHATLTQTGSKVVISDGPDGQAAAAYLLSPSNTLGSGAASLMSDMRPNQQIALSQGINDSGLFELNFNDERYLPFEGTGAVSHWKLEIPKESNPASFESLSDVIIQLRYTALSGGAGFKTAVQSALASLVH